MLRKPLAYAFTAIAWLLPSSARAEELDLQNDGFVEKGQAACQQGFVVGDQGASSFSHDTPYTLQAVRFLFCGADTVETITLRVYRETGVAQPGPELFSGDFTVQGAADALTEVDLAGERLAFGAGEGFRVAVEARHDGPPALARDTDGTIEPGKNWVYDVNSAAWHESEFFNLTGDWVIRAHIVAEDGGGGAGGTSPTTTTTTTTTGPGTGGGAGESGEDDGCSAAGGRSGVRGALALACLIVLARRRR